MSGRELVVVGAVALLVFGGGLLFFLLVWGVGGMGFGMMGPTMMGPRTTGSLGVVELLVCLVPIGLVVLVILGAGAVWLVQHNNAKTTQMRASLPAQEPEVSSCPSCGRSVEPDWQVCPHCGTPLRENTV